MNHVSVLEEAAVNALNVRQGGIYLDATYGRGGHARRIAAAIGESGRLIVLDVDPDAIEHAHRMFGLDERVIVIQRNFRELGAVAQEHAGKRGVDGILMDLGVSSPQLEDAERGFSFRGPGPLDMRMDPARGMAASAWLKEVDGRTLARVLFEFGEERHARRIARALVRAREQAPITTTDRLAALVEQAIPAAARRDQRIHPATRTFQAIRIAINDEMEALDDALSSAVDALAPGGRLVVISFHSLEDRRVKRSIRAAATPPPASRRHPDRPAFMPQLRRVGMPVTPSEAEIKTNPRARSARMRVAEKLAPGASS